MWYYKKTHKYAPPLPIAPVESTVEQEGTFVPIDPIPMDPSIQSVVPGNGVVTEIIYDRYGIPLQDQTIIQTYNDGTTFPASTFPAGAPLDSVAGTEMVPPPSIMEPPASTMETVPDMEIYGAGAPAPGNAPTIGSGAPAGSV